MWGGGKVSNYLAPHIFAIPVKRRLCLREEAVFTASVSEGPVYEI